MKGIWLKRIIMSLAMPVILLTCYNKGVKISGASLTNFDFNNDGIVDMLDYNAAHEYYNTADINYDVNSDGIVDVYDFAIISKGMDPQFAENDYYSLGNTQNNLIYSSYAVLRNGLIYYRNTQEGNKLFQSKINSEERKKLTDDVISGINVLGNKIYYINESDGKKIYSMSSDGSERKVIISEASGDLLVSGAYIYYKGIDNKVYRTNLLGTDKKLVISDIVDKFTIKGLKLYYVNQSDNRKLYSAAIDGSDKSVIITDAVMSFSMEKGLIYYVNSMDNKIYSVTLQGENRTVKTEEQAQAINLSEGTIYYSAKSDGRLYKLSTEGGAASAVGQEKLPSEAQYAKLMVNGGWIFYTNASDENRLYRIETSGNSKMDMETIVEGRVAKTNNVNFRTAPNNTISSNVIATLPRESRIEVIGITNNGWYKVNAVINGELKTGYIYSHYMNIIKDTRVKTYLGTLSGKYESNNNVGAIANNPNDAGGKSYGVWQLASKVGSVNSFRTWLYDKNRNFYNTLTEGYTKDGNTFGDNFDNAWRLLALNNGQEFFSLQAEYIKTKYYDITVSITKRDLNIDIDSKSLALRSTVFSTAVQHGPYTAIIKTVNGQNPADERDFIDRIYKERAKFNLYFTKYLNDPAMLAGLSTRFTEEDADALSMYDYEQKFK